MPDALSETPIFRANLRGLARRGKTFDLCLRSRQLGVALALARAVPGLRFVLNHCGNPDISHEEFYAWRDMIAPLARHENVFVKMSGLSPNARADQQNFETFVPYLESLLDLFESSRIVWGSDWPVSAGPMPLDTWLDVSDRFLGTLTDGEADDIRWRNVRSLYAV